MKYSLLLFVTIIFVISACSRQSQQLSFPSAEGGGRYTTGGRGGDVYIVTNLEDDVRNPIEGSFRWAINKKGPRTIVFAVSGNISLKGHLRVSNGDLTIAGQTAPGDGICIKDYTFSINSDNVIIRHMRFRCGDEAMMNSSQDAMNGNRNKNVIIDHCSMSWSIDETASFYENENFTMQWCIISESLNHSGHEKGDHGYGGIWGGYKASFHHNLIADHISRLPRLQGSRYTREPDKEVMDFRNNVIFNWGFENVYGGEEGHYNIVNNYYKPGPATKDEDGLKYRILDLTQIYTGTRQGRVDTLGAGWYYIKGNFVAGSEDATNDNWKYGVQNVTEQQKDYSRVFVPFQFEEVHTQSAEEAFKSVLANAGATKPSRDMVDIRILDEVKSGNCTYGDKWGANSGIIDSQSSVGGWPDLKSVSASKDSDEDGMPDSWENIHGLDPENPSDRNKDSDKNGYTNLEDYLNYMAGEQ